MLELMWALSNPNAYEWARWAPENKEKYKNIKVEKISDTEKHRNPTFQNLMTETTNLVLSTRFRNDYRANAKQCVFYRGKWYLIIGVTENEEDVVPQQAALLGRNLYVEYYLELLEVDLP